jgi:NAD(P)H-quinone oxidoreductase subunit 5
MVLVLISSISLITLTYTYTFLEGDTYRDRFIGQLALLAAVISALVISGNSLMLSLCWCLTTPLLAALTRHCRTPAALAASSKLIKYHLVSDAFFCIAMISLWAVSGSTDIATINRLCAEHRIAAPALDIIAVLVVSSALIKSSVFPFHSWLFGTLEAPTTFSAFLHAGLINIAGFISFRLAPVIFSSVIAPWILAMFGLLSATFGALCSLVQPDVKGKLVFSTVAQMGFMCLQCGLGAFSAALFHLICHGYFKCYLFLNAGSIITSSKTGEFKATSKGTLYPALVAIPLLATLFFVRNSVAVTLLSALIFAISLLYECLRVKATYPISLLDLGFRFMAPMIIFVAIYATASAAFSSVLSVPESPMISSVLLIFCGLMLVLWSVINASVPKVLKVPRVPKVQGFSVKDWLYVFAMNGGYFTHD